MNEPALENNSFILEGGKRCTLLFLPDEVEVIDCYKFNRKERYQICIYIYQNYSKERSIQSLEAELSLHVYCYSIGIEKEHSKDASLDRKEDRRWYVVMGYSFLEVLGF